MLSPIYLTKYYCSATQCLQYCGHTYHPIKAFYKFTMYKSDWILEVWEKTLKIRSAKTSVRLNVSQLTMSFQSNVYDAYNTIIKKENDAIYIIAKLNLLYAEFLTYLGEDVINYTKMLIAKKFI